MYTIRERGEWTNLVPVTIASALEAYRTARSISLHCGIACHVCENDAIAIVTFDETGREVYNLYR